MKSTWNIRKSRGQSINATTQNKEVESKEELAMVPVADAI